MVLEEGAKAVLMNFGLGLFFGMIPFLLFLRGFLLPFLSVRFNQGRYLLRVHLGDGVKVKFCVGHPFGSNAVMYKVGKEEFIVSLERSVAKRSMGVFWVDVPFGDTAPYHFEKVEWLTKDVVKTVDGEELTVKERFLGLFKGWNDSNAIMISIRTALMQPRKGFALGNFDWKKILILLGIVVVAIWVMNNGGLEGLFSPPAAANTIG